MFAIGKQLNCCLEHSFGNMPIHNSTSYDQHDNSIELVMTSVFWIKICFSCFESRHSNKYCFFLFFEAVYTTIKKHILLQGPNRHNKPKSSCDSKIKKITFGWDQSFADVLQNRCSQAWRPATLVPRDSNTGVFLRILRNL